MAATEAMAATEEMLPIINSMEFKLRTLQSQTPRQSIPAVVAMEETEAIMGIQEVPVRLLVLQVLEVRRDMLDSMELWREAYSSDTIRLLP